MFWATVSMYRWLLFSERDTTWAQMSGPNILGIFRRCKAKTTMRNFTLPYLSHVHHICHVYVTWNRSFSKVGKGSLSLCSVLSPAPHPQGAFKSQSPFISCRLSGINLLIAKLEFNKIM